MIAMNHRLVHTVVNRCDLPGDGDILVPVRTVCVIGTTDSRPTTPTTSTIGRDEVQQMLDAGEVLVPGFRQARALHAWSGCAPAVQGRAGSAVDGADTRHMSRGLAMVDHLERDGLRGFLTITGGKLTTFRLMAENVVDAMCSQLGEPRRAARAEEALPGSEGGEQLRGSAHRLADAGARPGRGADRLRVRAGVAPRDRGGGAARPGMNLDDVRRQLRLGMGPCQGGFCTYRAAGILHEAGDADSGARRRPAADVPPAPLEGLEPILYGDQVRQAVPRRLDLPGHPRRGAPARGGPQRPV